MTTARCLKCGFAVRGRFKSGPPKTCPVCGFNGSANVMRKMVELKQEKRNDNPTERTAKG